MHTEIYCKNDDWQKGKQKMMSGMHSKNEELLGGFPRHHPFVVYAKS